GLTRRARTPVRAEGELADLDVVPRRLRLLLGHPDGSDFGVAVGDARDVGVVDAVAPLPGDDLGRDDALVRRLVREERRTRAVADGLDARDVRAHQVVDDDEALLRLDAGLLQSDVLDDRRAADRREHALGLDRLRLPVLRLDRQLDAVLADIRLLEPRAGVDVDAALLERRCDRRRGLRILVRQHPVQRLDDRDLGAEVDVDVGELHPDRARADDGERLRQRLGEDRVIQAPVAVAVDLQDRDRARPRAGRDDDVLRLDHPLLALPRGLLVTVAGVRAGIDLDLAVAQQAAPPLDVLDLVLLEQERDAPRPLLRDLAGALPGRADVELHVADRDAEIAQPARDVP